MKGIEVSLNEIFEKCLDEVGEISEKELKNAAKDLANDLKSTSPKKTGMYSSSWTYKKEGNTFIVFNKNYGWKTYLLENGHVIRNKKGEYGRAPAHPHIKAAEQRAITKLLADMENKL